MRKPFFSKTTIQMLGMSFVGLVIIVVMSLHVGASLRERVREPASAPSVPATSSTTAVR